MQKTLRFLAQLFVEGETKEKIDKCFPIDL